ncbi:VanZ family protein [Lentilactobacillus buchneri]|uniref:VanZ-like domain-containing protein n=2 Tax=Lentilactobacillus buchneri TaxID=1581 RepID=A0A4R5NTC2_LENBU|nr:VanZ family protein [Lentilactobacillus buchneri]WCJ51550.1 VanZ family protein [Lentilactobacillus sp. Egmn17]AEB73092.1 VanZ family protein [Lentilactobacillus buchneri NRRL B-30929]KRK68297.1 VanZ family protein [Lentilactobacillus buchneri DSM 20057]MCT2899658.1 VanZ family protein [Lentilactobacillus buchneri]MCT3252026.1 VanZ family protein [Lentilactobacillus buchneri]
MIKWLPYLLNITGVLVWLKIQSRNLRQLTWCQLFTIVTSIIYILVVSYLTLAPTSYAFVGPQQVSPMMIGSAPINLIPFWSTTADFYQNVVMMLPMGVYLGLLLPKFNLRKVLLTGLSVSLTIESLQFVLDLSVGLSRWVDINDVLTNTFGVIVGWLILKGLMHTIFQRLLSHFAITAFSHQKGK